jgi:hypothetical protein
MYFHFASLDEVVVRVQVTDLEETRKLLVDYAFPSIIPLLLNLDFKLVKYSF